ncbi:MAG TPA: HEAT repeat domain-containing protein [Kofleriaceae bacterium]
MAIRCLEAMAMPGRSRARAAAAVRGPKRGRTIRVRWLTAVAVLLAAGAARAAPLAVLAEDVDGDGVPDAIELGADGVVHIAGKPRGEVKLAAAIAHGRLAVAHYRGKPYVVAEITTGGAAGPAGAAGGQREAVILYADGGGWREALRVPVGGVGLDHDYGFEVDATADGIYRYQTRSDIRRCDGKPAYLFAEKFDGARFRRASALPSNVPDTAPVIAARLDGARPAPPLLYQAHAASYEVGVGDAGGLAIPHELDDGRLDTLWREELAASTGEGQFFTFEPRAAGARARQLRIVPGNPASAATLRSFNRPRRLAIVAAQAAWRVELPDAAGEPPGAAYTVDLPEPIAGCVTVVLESSYGPAQGATAIAELEVFAEGERSAGGEALLAHVVAQDAAGATTAAAALGQRGAAGAAAIDAELATTTAPGARRRLVRALAGIADPAAAATLAHAERAGWVRDQDLIDVIGALGALGQVQELHDVAANAAMPAAARAAAVAQLPVTGPGLALLVELAGTGGRDLRRAVIDRLSSAPVAALLAAVAAQSRAPAAGDLWRAMTRGARRAPASRAAVVAAMLAALPAATDYERRYRLIDGIAALGDAAALATVEGLFRALPATAEAAALRQVAVRAIASAPRPEAVRFVLDRVRDRDPGVRLAALAALAGGEGDAGAEAGVEAGVDAIDRAIGDASAEDDWPEVRRRAASALGTRCQRPGPAKALGEALDHDPDLGVRGDALSALVQCRAPGTAERLARIWDDAKLPTELRSRAVLEAVPLGDPKLAAALVGRFARWRGESVSSAAALELAQSAAASIGRLRPPGAAAALIDALDDTGFPEIVQAAALGLGALGPACPAAAKIRLTELGRSETPSAPVARRAAAQCGR